MGALAVAWGGGRGGGGPEPLEELIEGAPEAGEGAWDLDACLAFVPGEGGPALLLRAPSFLGATPGGGGSCLAEEALTPGPAKRTKKGAGDQEGLAFVWLAWLKRGPQVPSRWSRGRCARAEGGWDRSTDHHVLVRPAHPPPAGGSRGHTSHSDRDKGCVREAPASSELWATPLCRAERTWHCWR